MQAHGFEAHGKVRYVEPAMFADYFVAQSEGDSSNSGDWNGVTIGKADVRSRGRLEVCEVLLVTGHAVCCTRVNAQKEVRRFACGAASAFNESCWEWGCGSSVIDTREDGVGVHWERSVFPNRGVGREESCECG